MNCRKRKYDPEEILNKITGNEPLDHCEELFYLVHMLHLPEEEAEGMLYGIEKENGLIWDIAE